MPNYVKNLISASKEVFDEYVNEAGDFDFEKVIPAPAVDDEMFTNKGKTLASGIVLYELRGYSRLDWNRENWGTKWNASDTLRDEEKSISFITAWQHPFKVVEALSLLHPEVEFNVEFSNEDFNGDYHGAYKITNGVREEIHEDKADIIAKLWD